MVSNNEINQILSDRRQGIYNNGYLVCDTCGGYYKLKSGEKPDDYSSECVCGGNLTYERTLEIDGEDSDEDSFDSPVLNWLSRPRNMIKIRIVLRSIIFGVLLFFLLAMMFMKMISGQ